MLICKRTDGIFCSKSPHECDALCTVTASGSVLALWFNKWLDQSQSRRLSWCAPGNGCPAPFQTWMLSMEMLLCAWALSFELPWHACWVLQLSMVMTPEIVKTLKIKSLNERIVQGNQTGFVPCFLLCVLFSPEQSCVYWVVPVSLLVQAKSWAALETEACCRKPPVTQRWWLVNVWHILESRWDLKTLPETNSIFSCENH